MLSVDRICLGFGIDKYFNEKELSRATADASRAADFERRAKENEQEVVKKFERTSSERDSLEKKNDDLQKTQASLSDQLTATKARADKLDKDNAALVAENAALKSQLGKRAPRGDPPPAPPAMSLKLDDTSNSIAALMYRQGKVKFSTLQSQLGLEAGDLSFHLNQMQEQALLNKNFFDEDNTILGRSEGGSYELTQRGLAWYRGEKCRRIDLRTLAPISGEKGEAMR